MTSRKPQFYDPVDLSVYPLTEQRWCSAQQRPLMITDLPGIKKEQIDTCTRSIWRYARALPMPIKKPVSLGEGCTPLLARRYNGIDLHFKLEWMNPTGSFKDRGASVMISFLKDLGIEAIIEDSSGNGGAAIAAYGQAAGLNTKIVAPAGNSPNKLLQSKAYGAQVELVEGPRIASEQRAIEQSEYYFYASHNWHPFFLQGTKTIGYEIWEDLGFRAPDNIIMPVGAGSNLLGCHMAFKELLTVGQIDKLPRLFAVQPQNCSPLFAAFRQQQANPVKPTIAEGTAIAAPLRLEQMLESVRHSAGEVLTASEEQIIAGVKELASLSYYVEPTCASVCAAINQLRENGTINSEQTTVIILTGSGLKAGDKLTRIYQDRTK